MNRTIAMRGPALLLASLFTAMCCASPVFAADEIVERDGETLLVRTYSANEDIEENITHEGVSYTMRDMQTVALPQREEKQVATKVVKTESDTDDAEQLLSLFEPEMNHEMDGFTGTLALDSDSIEAEPGEAVPYSYTITDERQYCGLERDDPALIPKTAEKDGAVLGLTGIGWTRTEEPDGSVWYAAAATYAGTASGTAAGKYTVRATYSGELTKKVDGGVEYRVTYGPAAPPVTVQESITSIEPAEVSGTPESVSVPLPPEPDREPIDWKPVLVIGIPFAVLLCGVAVAIMKREQIGEALRGLRNHAEPDDEDDDELFPVNQEGGKMRIPRAMRCMDRGTDEEGGNE